MTSVPNWEKIAEKEHQMRAHADANILELFAIAELDPKRHFRGNDWRFIKFDGLDLRGCDMSHTRLFGASWSNTLVAGVKFAGSDVETTKLYKAADWKEAELTEEQREKIEILHLKSNKPSLSDIRSLAERGKIEEKQWTWMIKAADDFVAAHDIYRIMVDLGLGDNKYAVTTLLDKADNSDSVDLVRSYISEYGVEIDSYAVATLISKAQSEDEAVDLFRKYVKTDEFGQGVEPTQYVFNSLISKFDFFEKAEPYIELMKRNGVKIDAFTINPIIWKARTFTGARWLYDLIPEPRTMDMNAVLSHAKWQDFEKGDRPALNLLQSGPDPDLNTCNIIIGKCNTYPDGYSVYKLFKDRGLFDDRKTRPDRYTAYALLGLISERDEWGVDRAFSLLIEFVTEFRSFDIIEDPDVARKLERIIGLRVNRIKYRSDAPEGHLESGRDYLLRLAAAFANKRVMENFEEATERPLP